MNAGEGHNSYLVGAWTIDDAFGIVSAAPDGAENAVRFCRGWFLGTGRQHSARQLAQGPPLRLQVSKSDKLLDILSGVRQ